MPSPQIFQVTISGADDLARLFNELPKSMTDQALRAAETKALQPVLDEAKTRLVQESRVRTGNLLNSMMITLRLKASQQSFETKGGVTLYAGAAGKKGAHAHLIEFGHRLVGGGRVPPHPFLRPAWDSKKDEVLAVMRAEIWNTLVSAVRRLRTRAEKGRLSKSQTSFFSR